MFFQFTVHLCNPQRLRRGHGSVVCIWHPRFFKLHWPPFLYGAKRNVKWGLCGWTENKESYLVISTHLKVITVLNYIDWFIFRRLGVQMQQNTWNMTFTFKEMFRHKSRGSIKGVNSFERRPPQQEKKTSLKMGTSKNHLTHFEGDSLNVTDPVKSLAGFHQKTWLLP